MSLSAPSRCAPSLRADTSAVIARIILGLVEACFYAGAVADANMEVEGITEVQASSTCYRFGTPNKSWRACF